MPTRRSQCLVAGVLVLLATGCARRGFEDPGDDRPALGDAASGGDQQAPSGDAQSGGDDLPGGDAHIGPFCDADSDCEDHVACTLDLCVLATHACLNIPEHSRCDNQLFCDGPERCDAQSDCIAGALPCLDSDPETYDFCDEASDSCDNFIPVVAPATGLGWLQRSPHFEEAVTARWTRSTSAGLVSQELRLFADAQCSTPHGAPLDLGSATDESHPLTAWEGATLTFSILSRDDLGARQISECSPPMLIRRPTAGLWTWMGGSSWIDQAGEFGTQGVLGTDRDPGSRSAMAVLRGPPGEGDSWFFGGYGNGLVTWQGPLDDLWRVRLSDFGLAWEFGIGEPNADPDYNTPKPGGREGASGHRLSDGSLLVLFGRVHLDNYMFTNGVWMFVPGPLEGWSLLAGRDHTSDAPPDYGVLRVPAATNMPGARIGQVSWMEGDSLLWVFGGNGYVEGGGNGALNDLWTFDLGTRWWTWRHGASTQNPAAIGTLGVASDSARPAGSGAACGSLDSQGRYWLFGGSNNNSRSSRLWRFDRHSMQWTWVAGPSGTNLAGAYGVRGVPAAGQYPGSRYAMQCWMDAQDRFWVYGGWGHDAAGTLGTLNDLWLYNPVLEQWAWMGGSQVCEDRGSFGVRGVTDSDNWPPARQAGAVLRDGEAIWIYGGGAVRGHEFWDLEYFHDLWRWTP